MTSFKEEFMRSRELAEVGVEAELYRNDDGMLLVRQVPPPPVTITPEGDIDMGTVGEAVQELPRAIAGAVPGLVTGGVRGVAEVAALVGSAIPGAYAAYQAGDDEGLRSYLSVLQEHSDTYGGGKIKALADNVLDMMGVSEKDQEQFNLAADVGEIYGIGEGVVRAPIVAARQAGPALRAIDRAGQRAQARLDENVGTTLMSGIDPKRTADELTAGAGQVARLMLPDVQKQMKMDKRMSMQPPAVLEALTDQDRELIKKLAGEKRASESVEPGLDDMSIIDADEFMRARSKQEPTPPPPPARKQDELGFYSRAQDFIDNLKQEKLTGQQLRGQMLNAGVKPDELKWTGLDEFLEKNPKLTKQEAMDFIEDNKVRLEEITYQGGTLNPETHQSFTEPQAIRDESEIMFHRERIDEYVDEHLEGVFTELGVEPDDIPMHIDAYTDLQDATGGRVFNPSQEVLGPLQARYPEVDVENIGRQVDEKLDELAEDFYNDNPFYEVDGEGALEDYRIVGNDDIGYYVTYEGEAVKGIDEVYSINEAQVQIQNDAMERGLLGFEGETQYSEYTQPGAENYREVLLTNPDYRGDPAFELGEKRSARLRELQNKSRGAAYDRNPPLTSAEKAEYNNLKRIDDQLFSKRGQGVSSPHWNEDDVVAHVRLSDRKAGRYTEDGRFITTEANFDDVGKVLYIEEIQSDWAQMGRRRGFGLLEPRSYSVKKNYTRKKLNPDTNEYELIDGYVVVDDELYAKNPTGPYARGENPVIGAVDNVYDTVEEANKRAEEASTSLQLGVPEGPLVGTTEKFTEATMRRLIRKAADEGYDYIAWTPGDVQVDRWAEQGLETYYNKVLPKSTKKVAQSLDKEAKVEPIEISMGLERQETLALRITDKLKKMAKEGQPLFAVPAAAGAGAALTSKEERNGNL